MMLLVVDNTLRSILLHRMTGFSATLRSTALGRMTLGTTTTGMRTNHISKHFFEREIVFVL
jgi:hypothetical protein